MFIVRRTFTFFYVYPLGELIELVLFSIDMNSLREIIYLKQNILISNS